MRIALVITALGAGGAERVLIGLAGHWAAGGHAVTLITFERPGTRPYYALDSRVELCQLDHPGEPGPAWRGVVGSLVRIRALRRELRRIRPDVAIAFLVKINILTALAGRGLGVPVIVSERNNPERQRLNPIWRALRLRLYRRAAAVVTPSRGVLEAFPPAIRARGRVIPNPVTPPTGVPAARADRTLVAVGRLVPQKGFDLLLDAFARVAAAHPEWRLVIFGEGPERPRLEARAEALGVTGRVRLPGVTARPGAWAATGEIFVLSSRFESFGNVLTEALAAGLPVVAFDCPFGPGDIVRDGEDGVLVAPESVDALAAALAALMADGERRRAMGAAARAGAARFDPPRIAALWDELIATVVPAAGPTRAEPAPTLEVEST